MTKGLAGGQVKAMVIAKLLQRVKTTLQQGGAPSTFDETVQLLATSVVQHALNLAAGTVPAAPGAVPKRPDFVRELQPALASSCPLVGVLAEPSLLFATHGQARALRQQLLSERRVLAVVALPQGLLRSSQMGLCLILLVPPGAAKSVTLVDASVDEAGFAGAGPAKRQRALVDVDRLATTLAKATGGWWVTRLPAGAPALLESLQPRQHVMDPVDRQVADYFAAHGEFRLGDAVDCIPPLGNAAADDAHVTVRVVGSDDLPRLGLVQGASGERPLAADVAQRRPQAFLRPGDLLVGHSRAGGFHVAVVPETVSAAGAGRWLAARGIWVYRPRAGSALNARVLAVMLASPLGAHLLDGVLGGRVHARLLLELRLPAVDKSEAKRASALFEQQVRCEQKLRDLAQHQAALRHQFWPLEASLPEARATP